MARRLSNSPKVDKRSRQEVRFPRLRLMADRSLSQSLSRLPHCHQLAPISRAPISSSRSTTCRTRLSETPPQRRSPLLIRRPWLIRAFRSISRPSSPIAAAPRRTMRLLSYHQFRFPCCHRCQWTRRSLNPSRSRRSPVFNQTTLLGRSITTLRNRPRQNRSVELCN